MKKLLLLFAFFLAPLSALAQNAITLPIAANAVADLGNGPIKVRMIAGNASIFTSLGSGVGSTSGSSTALTLTTTPATPPIVGGLISGSGIASGTTVAAYNGTTGITLSAAMTVPSSTTVSWGSACPSSPSGNVIQASAMAGYYIMYTQARVCAVSPGGPVNTLLIEPIFYDSVLPAVSVVGPVTPGGIPIFNSPTTVKDSGVFLIPNGTTLFASPSGSDTGNNCTSSATPCTFHGVCAMRTVIATFLQSINGSLPISLADGTYSDASVNSSLCTIFGNSGGSASILTTITGDCTTPANVVLAVPANKAAISTKDVSEVSAGCFEVTGGNGSFGFTGAQFSVFDYQNVIWGAWGTGGTHVSMGTLSTVNLLPGGETITASVAFHWSLGTGAALSASGATTTCTGSPAFTDFVSVTAGYLNMGGWATSGCGGATGGQASLVGPGYMGNGGFACASYFPGNSGCTIELGFQDDAFDNQTAAQPVGGTTCTLTAVSHLTVVKGVVTLCN